MPMVKQPLAIEHALLGFVRQQPMYGYEIHQRLLENEALGRVWRLKQSLLYAHLGRLEEEGYLAATLEAQGVRPPRKVLALTPAGLEAFLGWIRRPVGHGRDFRLEFLAKLYFARQEGLPIADDLIRDQRALAARWLADLREQAAQIKSERSYDQLVLSFRAGQIEAALAWLDVCASWLTAGRTT